MADLYKPDQLRWGLGSPVGATSGNPLAPTTTNSLSGFGMLAPAGSSNGSFGGSALGMLSSYTQRKRRKAFFSFYYADVMRVNNVRKSWEFVNKDNALTGSSTLGFYDGSLWESRKRSGDESLKQLIRDGVQHTSAVCVLIGSETWSRRWVRYEIARAVIDKRGLLAVHINGLNHHQYRAPHPKGMNPLHFVGVRKFATGKFYLYELIWVTTNFLTLHGEWQWHPYRDYDWAVSLPRYLKEPDTGWIMPLSAGALEYDYVTGEGQKNIGAWIDHAAEMVGR
jgi:MTH538 TIR-like domain (DUF1863)